MRFSKVSGITHVESQGDDSKHDFVINGKGASDLEFAERVEIIIRHGDGFTGGASG